MGRTMRHSPKVNFKRSDPRARYNGRRSAEEDSAADRRRRLVDAMRREQGERERK
jgi:hypothetical protein